MVGKCKESTFSFLSLWPLRDTEDNKLSSVWTIFWPEEFSSGCFCIITLHIFISELNGKQFLFACVAFFTIPMLRGVEWVHGLFLFPLCFRESVVATCKIGSFLCSLDNLLQKNVILLFFGNQISKWRSFEKKGLFLTYFSHFLVTREKLQKNPSARISLTYIHIFCSPYWLFLP